MHKRIIAILLSTVFSAGFSPVVARAADFPLKKPSSVQPSANPAEKAKLERALAEIRAGHYAKAQAIYQSVLMDNSSPQLRANVTRALANVDALLRLPAGEEMVAPVAQEITAPQPVPAIAQLAAEPMPGEAVHLSTPLQTSTPLQAGTISTLRPPAIPAPPTADMESLRHAMMSEPMNLDRYFAFAQKAQAEGRVKEAELTYISMLELDPKLDRIRLELAALYVQSGEFAKAKPLLQEALSHNPPVNVRKNIESLLASIRQAMRKNIVERTASLGFNYDSNANSASSSDAISVFDQTVDLPDGARSSDDGQLFASASIAHTYRFDKSASMPDVASRWYSTGTAYKADQDQLPSLNLTVFSVRTGPVFDIAAYKTTVGIVGGYNYVALGGTDYLNDISFETNMNHAVNQKLSLQFASLSEGRRFNNSPASSTLTDRNGNAWQETFGATYVLDDRNVVNGQLIFRQENTRVAWLSNNALGASAGYTHGFEDDIFGNVTGSYRDAEYSGPDPLISAITTREDKESVIGVTVGKNFSDFIMGTVGYQYRNVDSNLQNYNYDNHRIASSVGVKF